MPSDLIRITLDKPSSSFIVEYGVRISGLSEAQKKEIKLLEDELMAYQDFTTAEELENVERQVLMEKKQRYEKLQEMERAERIEWAPIEARFIETVLLILDPINIPIYVENLPSQMLQKLLEPQLTLNLAVQPSGLQPSQIRAPESENLKKVLDALLSVTEVDWKKWLDITEEAGVVYVRPNKFLKDDWGPINTALRARFGNDIWKSKGKGDKNAHWRIEFK